MTAPVACGYVASAVLSFAALREPKDDRAGHVITAVLCVLWPLTLAVVLTMGVLGGIVTWREMRTMRSKL